VVEDEDEANDLEEEQEANIEMKAKELRAPTGRYAKQYVTELPCHKNK